jgi:hypothetical protein
MAAKPSVLIANQPEESWVMEWEVVGCCREDLPAERSGLQGDGHGCEQADGIQVPLPADANALAWCEQRMAPWLWSRLSP